MLDIKFIKENQDIVKLAIERKNLKINLDDLINLDKKRIELSQKIDERKAIQNSVSLKIPSASLEEKEKLVKEMSLIKEEIKSFENELNLILNDWRNQMLHIPNIPDATSPIGPDESYSKVVKEWGEKPNFSFTPKDHLELMTNLDIVDFERGVKVHGFRGYFLKGDAVRLCFAIWNYALDFFSERGFNPIIPPINVKKDALLGCGFLPDGEADIYKAQDENYFVGTSEVPLMGMYQDEILEKKSLPIKMLGFSPCFRLEAGSYSKDIKGLIRVHEFYKFEQVVLCEGSHEESVKNFEQLQKNVEDFIESLNIPYHRLDAATGDMGLAKVKMYDTELWVPKENTFREISSCSYFHDFQTRRLGIRYKDEDGKIKFTHSLNCTAIPTPRILVSLFENFQTEDGSINIPNILHKYFGKDKIQKLK